jgi:hypothetical protein
MMSMEEEEFEYEAELCMDLLAAKRPWLVEAWDEIERSLAPIDVYQRGLKWRGAWPMLGRECFGERCLIKLAEVEADVGEVSIDGVDD